MCRSQQRKREFVVAHPSITEDETLVLYSDHERYLLKVSIHQNRPKSTPCNSVEYRHSMRAYFRNLAERSLNLIVPGGVDASGARKQWSQ